MNQYLITHIFVREIVPGYLAPVDWACKKYPGNHPGYIQGFDESDILSEEVIQAFVDNGILVKLSNPHRIITQGVRPYLISSGEVILIDANLEMESVMKQIRHSIVIHRFKMPNKFVALIKKLFRL